MKYYFFFVLLLTLTVTYGQNKQLDTNAITHWPSVGDISMSNDGAYVAYETFLTPSAPNLPRDSQTLVLQATHGRWKKTLPGAALPARFSADGHWCIFHLKDTLIIQGLGNSERRTIPRVTEDHSYLFKTHELLAYRQNSDDLIVRDLSNMAQWVLKAVHGFTFEHSQSALCYVTKNRQDFELKVYNIATGKFKLLWSGSAEPKNLLLDQQDARLAFTLETASGNGLYSLDLKSQHLDSIQIPADIQLTAIDRFGKDRDLLFLHGQDLVSMGSGSQQPVQIWNAADNWLAPKYEQAHQQNRSYLFVYDYASSRLSRIEYPDQRAQFGTNNERRFLINETRGDYFGFAGDYYWNKNIYAVYLLDIESGRKEKVDVGPRNFISPDGRYVISQSELGGDIFSLDYEASARQNLTYQLPVPLLDDAEERPISKRSRGFRFYRWSGAHKFLMYDRYDIWEISADGSATPTCLTNGFGRRNQIIFRGVDNAFSKGRPAVINAYNNMDKCNGFYRIRKGANPLLLTMAPCIYDAPDAIPGNYYGMSPMKAVGTNLWVVRRSSAVESPNYFWTKDFEKFRAISNAYPEAAYHWFSNELFDFKTKAGVATQAILYKPDNFDPTKRYPVLFNYYEKKSNMLNAYLLPGYTMVEAGGYDFNIPMMLAHGYLVCVTDIHFKVGETARSAVEAIEGAADHLIRLPFIDSTRLGACGGSFAGYETNCLAAFSHRFKALVSISAHSDLISGYGTIDDTGPENIENRQGGMGISLSSDPARYLKNSPVAFAGNVTTPILIIDTREDHNVNQRQGIEWFISLRRERKSAWLVQYPEYSHGVPWNRYPDFYQRYIAFFDYYLQGAPMPVWMGRQYK